MCYNVRLDRSSVRAIRDSVDRITEIVKSGTEVFV